MLALMPFEMKNTAARRNEIKSIFPLCENVFNELAKKLLSERTSSPFRKSF
jgi:hypothetical protein